MTFDELRTDLVVLCLAVGAGISGALGVPVAAALLAVLAVVLTRHSTERTQPMKNTRASRPIPLALTALVALFSALTALALTNGMNMAAAHDHGRMTMTMEHHRAPALSPKAVTLRLHMRKLWEDHITWTRLAIISLTTDAPDTEATVGRLLQNQTDIGNAVKPFYGAAAGNALTARLRDHILIAADVIAAAKAGDSAALAEAQARWVANADDISVFLHAANPRFWPLAEVKAMMHRHLDLTTAEVVARLHADWAGDVVAYDRVHRHILHMSDMLTSGLVRQFPARFR